MRISREEHLALADTATRIQKSLDRLNYALASSYAHMIVNMLSKRQSIHERLFELTGQSVVVEDEHTTIAGILEERGASTFFVVMPAMDSTVRGEASFVEENVARISTPKHAPRPIIHLSERA